MGGRQVDARREERRRQRRKAKQEKAARRWEAVSAFTLPDVPAIVAELLERTPGRPLEEYDHRVTSQHGEDGLTVEIFRRIGVEHRRCVELGCGFNGGNAGVLVAGLGFEGLLVDGSMQLVEVARKVYAGHGSAQIECAWISRETLEELLGARGFDRDLDYLGIDLDGIDYWLWDAFPTRPRMVICEFNPFLGREAAVTIPYSADFSRKALDESGRRRRYPPAYWGASIAAFAALGRRKGYRLVGSAPRSTNAYFVRDDVADGLPAVSPADAWRPVMKPRTPEPVHMELYDEINRDDVRQYYLDKGFPLVEVD